MYTSHRALACALALVSTPAFAGETEDLDRPGIIVTGEKPEQPAAQTPATSVSIDAQRIAAQVNAVSIEDTLKYLPSLVVRKRSIGDNFAPIATRTSGLGASARSLIYADGALLSALIGNNNGNASPKWNLVATEQVERIDVLYGPFSAAYSGNSIGTVVAITTRMPDSLEAQATALFNHQWHEQYGTKLKLPTGQFSASLGDRSGRLAWTLSAAHTISNGQPVSYVVAASAPAGTTGAIPGLTRLGAPTKVIGASDIDHHEETTARLKLAYDLTDTVRASYTLAAVFHTTDARAESYLRNAAGDAVFTSGFNAGVYRREQRHMSHALAFDGRGERFDWQVIGTLFDYAKDRQAGPATALPASLGGGAGQEQRQDGTGWWTLDARGTLRQGDHAVSLGGHIDRYELQTRTFAVADWREPVPGTRTAASLGKTRTAALWLQDEWLLAEPLTLTLGARQEWWRAFGGFNQTSAANPGIAQPERSAAKFSPKATLAWRPAPAWTIRASFGQAWRFPTVGELYQATTVGTVLANPNPDLRPERARSGELAVEYRDRGGFARIALFDEVIDDALIAQSAPVTATQPNGTSVTTSVSFVQNVDRTRARGVEVAIDRRDVFPGLDLAASVTYADAVTSANAAFPASIGKLLPSVPHWKANAVVTWRPVPSVSLTAAARMSSRNYGTLDNADTIGNTWQGFYKYAVVDLRMAWTVNDHVELAVGIDNLGNDRYFLFHPFPQRSVTGSVRWKL